jgi:hypothetical protein
VRDEGDDAHLPATKWAQQREYLVDAGDQHRPETVCRALGLHRLDRHGLGWGCVACPRCAYARAGWLGLHLRRLHHCALCQRHNRCPVRRVRCKHTKLAVAMRARGLHQGCNAFDQLQWRACDFIDLCAPLVVGFADRLAMLFRTAVRQHTARLAQPLQCKTVAVRSSATNAPGRRGLALQCKRWCLPKNRCGGKPASL